MDIGNYVLRYGKREGEEEESERPAGLSIEVSNRGLQVFSSSNIFCTPTREKEKMD